MENRSTTLSLTALVLLIALLLAGLTWANYRYASQNPGGNDFLPRWAGTRLYFENGWSPYSREASRSIQRMVYGRAAREGEDQVLFVYPFYSFILFAPFALVENYDLARALWMTTLEISLVLLTFLGLSLSQWKPRRYLLVLLLIFALLWYHGLRPVINGNASILVGLFIALAFVCIRAEQDALAGVLLGLATIKPQMVVLLIPFVLLWAVSQRRWALFVTTIATVGFLVAATSLLLPGWLIDNLTQILTYPEYTQPGSPGGIFALVMPGFGRQLGWVLTAVMAGFLLIEWFSAWGKDFRWLLWTAYLTLVITNLIGVRTATENYIALLPGLILVFTTWDERWGRPGRWFIWISMALLFFGLWALFLKTLTPGVAHAIQHPIMFFPFPLFMIIGLYWVRWWFTRPPRVYLDQLRQMQGIRLE
jgi:hypothetical protein